MRPVFRYMATEGVKRKKGIAPEHSPRFFTTFAPMENSYRYDGITLRYDVEGEGETLLLLHGWGCDREIWKQIRPLLSRHYRVVSVDFAGFGRSDEPTTVWGVEEYTRSIEQLARELEIDSPTLVGHSFGGRVAILYSSRNAARRVVLTDAAGIRPHRPISYYYKVYSYKLLKRLLPVMVGGGRARQLIEQRRAKTGSSDYNNASPMMRAILSKCVGEDLRGVMPAIGAPVLLFWGDRDTATPLSDARTMERLIPDARLVVAHGCGHFAMIENGELFRRTIAQFLDIEQQQP